MTKRIIIDRNAILASREEDLSRRPDLLELREFAAKTADPVLQNKLALAVHRDYTREAVANDGIVSGVANALGAMPYALVKTVALGGSKTAQAVLEQVPGGNITARTSEPGPLVETGAAWRGLKDGLQDRAIRAGVGMGESLRSTLKRVFGD